VGVGTELPHDRGGGPGHPLRFDVQPGHQPSPLYHMEHVPYGTLSHAHIASPGTPACCRRPPCPRRRDRRPEPAPDRRGDRHQPPDAHLPFPIPRRAPGPRHPPTLAPPPPRPPP